MHSRTINLSAVVLICITLLSGCVPGQYYHSSADIPRYSRTVNSELTIVRANSRGDRSYGLIVAADYESGNRKVTYLLIAPVLGMNTGLSMEDFNLDACSVLTVDNAISLLVELDKAIKQWEAKTQAADGAFFEFTVAPEQPLKAPGRNMHPVKYFVKFTCGITRNNKAARLYFGLENVDAEILIRSHSVEFDSLDKLKDFQVLLDTGVARIQSKELIKK